MLAPMTMRAKHEALRVQLESERSSFLAHWRELGDHILPRRPRFYTSDINKGDRRNQKIIDSTPSIGAKTLRAGMMGGITSPARPWFRLTIGDPALSELSSVKTWLHIVGQRMANVFTKSNLYNALPIVYGDVGVFGTAAMLVEEDFEDVIRCYPLPIGSYMIATNEKLQVDVFIREFKMTVRQIVNKFGRTVNGEVDWSNISSHVKTLFESGTLEAWIDIVHIIRPNEMFDEKKLGSKFKRFLSCYYEKGTYGGQPYISAGKDDDKYLSEKGYDFFPVLAPRWEVTGEDAYGTDCPGMTALGDIKQLQHGEKRSAILLDLLTKPPMKGPPSLINSRPSILPGDMTFVDERDNKSFSPVFQVDWRTRELDQKQERIAQRILRAFYADLFLMLVNSDRREITAREIEERHEEKLLALGPVLEQLNQDLLDPLIALTFAFMDRQGMIPPAPDEIQNMDIKVEYISIMAQAQKLQSLGSLERIGSFAIQLKAAFPEAAIEDKLNLDQVLDVYGDITSQPPGIIRTDDEVGAIRADRAKAQQQAASVEAMNQGAQAARALSETKLEEDSALRRLLSQGDAGALVEGV